MSTLQETRDRIRLQMDLDSEDLPDGIADSFIKEGFDRTFAVEERWPFFETMWTLELVEGATTLEKPADVNFISSFRDIGRGTRLIQIAQRVAEDNFVGVLQPGEPNLFSVWGDTLQLWPPPTASARTYQLRGYRKPIWGAAGIDVLDGDDRLHSAIAHYATALAYAQLEDPELESTYMRRWGDSVNVFRADLLRPQHHEPLVLNGGLMGARRSRLR